MIALGLDIGGTSVKAALLRDGHPVGGAKSHRYERPDRTRLEAAISEAIGRLPACAPDVVGLCAPGLLAADRSRIERSVNVPGIAGVALEELVWSALGKPAGCLRIVSDVHAAGHDLWMSEGLKGRLLAIALGTGVGGIVLDDGRPLVVSGSSSGHLGQMDVTLEEPAPVGPDGGRGGLEAYAGLPALRARFGLALSGFVPTREEIAVRAIVRAVRIAHAVYRPDHVRLVGGVGLLIAPAGADVREMICDGLTSLARPEWTLGFGKDLFHAARGAAWLAADSAGAA